MNEMEKLARERLRPTALGLYRQQLQKRPERERYREYFLAKFGPDSLGRLNGRELLEEVPLKTKGQGMDYTLEFKNDSEFRQSDFGSISGGSAGKYGVYYSQKEGAWCGADHQAISEQKALELVQQRVAEVIEACGLLDSLEQRTVADLDPDWFQARVEQAAPNYSNSVWFHKYLHLYCPRLITWNHAEHYLESELYRVGQLARYNHQRYANDILALQFWSEILQEPALDVTPHWEHGPLSFWSFSVSDAVEAAGHIHEGCLRVGPSSLGDLTDAFSFPTQREMHAALKAEIKDVAEDVNLDFLKYLGYLRPTEIVILAKGSEVFAAGEVVEGGYFYVSGDLKPHRRRIRWLHDHSFEIDTPVAAGLQPVSRKKHGMNVPLIVRSLIAYAGGEWPNYQPILSSSVPQTVTPEKTEGQALVPPDDPITREILDIVKRKGQVILYGPPGTGKTYFAEWAALELVARQNFGVNRVELTSNHRKRAFQPGEENEVAYITTCTFHPAYSYEDFVEGYRPTSDGGFVLRDGTFKRAARAALQEPEKAYVLIIDEINRGNLPKIFGELITLLENNKRERTSVQLPVSGERFTVPKNLYLLATMNTADRSILLLDTALRRRFGFLELMPQAERLQTSQLERPHLASWLAALNRRIVHALGRDGRNLQVGHAYLMDDGKPIHTLKRFSFALRHEIWPLLQEYCYEDSQALAAILGVEPNGLYDTKCDDLAWSLFEAERREQLIAALDSLIEPEDIDRADESGPSDIEEN